MFLLALLTYHLAYHSGPIVVHVSYQAVADRYGNAGLTGGHVTIDNGVRHFTVDLAKLMPITAHHVLLATDVHYGCGAAQPVDVVSDYVVIESIWAEKGCRPAAYFIDANTGAIVETVDLDHRWDHRVDIQPAHFDGQPIRVERVDHIALASETFDVMAPRRDAGAWRFVIVRGRDATGNLRLYAYEYGKKHISGAVDPGWNVFPTPGSVVEVGPLKGLYVYSYHPNPDVLRLSAADDARYTERQAPTSRHYARALERNQWFMVMDEDAQALQFSQALAALAKVLSLDDDPSIRAGDKATYDDCRAMVAQLQAGKIRATSARTLWESNGCRMVSGSASARPNRWR